MSEKEISWSVVTIGAASLVEGLPRFAGGCVANTRQSAGRPSHRSLAICLSIHVQPDSLVEVVVAAVVRRACKTVQSSETA